MPCPVLARRYELPGKNKINVSRKAESWYIDFTNSRERGLLRKSQEKRKKTLVEQVLFCKHPQSKHVVRDLCGVRGSCYLCCVYNTAYHNDHNTNNINHELHNNNVVLWYTILYTLYHISMEYVVYVWLCCVVLWYAVLYTLYYISIEYVVYVMLCYIVLWYAVLYYIILVWSAWFTLSYILLWYAI